MVTLVMEKIISLIILKRFILLKQQYDFNLQPKWWKRGRGLPSK